MQRVTVRLELGLGLRFMGNGIMGNGSYRKQDVTLPG